MILDRGSSSIRRRQRSVVFGGRIGARPCRSRSRDAHRNAARTSLSKRSIRRTPRPDPSRRSRRPCARCRPSSNARISMIICSGVAGEHVERRIARPELDPDAGRDERCRPARLGGRGVDDRNAHGQLVVAARRRVVALAQPAGAAQGGLVAAAEPDRHVRALRRQRREAHLVPGMETAVERTRVAAPQLAPDGHGLGQIRAALAEAIAIAQVLELCLVPAHAHAHDQPAAGQRIDRRQLLGQLDRVAHGHDDDAGAQLHRRAAWRPR